MNSNLWEYLSPENHGKTVNYKEKRENNVDQQYCELLGDVIVNGVSKQDRTGTGTISVFGRTFRHSMKDGFPLLTSKKMYTKAIIIELLWFLGKHMEDVKYKDLGRTNIKYLVDNGCNIWVGDAYKNYRKMYAAEGQHKDSDQALTKEDYIDAIKNNYQFAALYGNLGPIYGKQWCSWGDNEIVPLTGTKNCTAGVVGHIDDLDDDSCEVEITSKKAYQNLGGFHQINKLIHDLETNPDSRRLMVTAWNPDDLEASVLPPCHYGFQCYTRLLTFDERAATLTGTQKSAITALGIPLVGGYQMGSHEVQSKADKMLDFLNVPTRALSLSWNQRSVDTPLGLPFNIASYGFLLCMIAKVVNMVPEDLIGNLGDTHIYNNQIDGVLTQLGNKTYPLPELKFRHDVYTKITGFDFIDFEILGYESAEKVEYPLSN